MSTLAAEGPYSAEDSLGSRAQLWIGRIVTTLVALFLVLDGGAKIAGYAPFVEGTVRLGFAAEVVPWIGAILVVSTAIYVLPRTAVIGAILLTGYLGGATATHVRAGEPWFFPVVVGLLVWAGLFLRDAGARGYLLDAVRGAHRHARQG